MPRTADHLLLPTDLQPTVTLGRAIVARRDLLDMSQEHLASRSGLSRKYMSDVENGKRNLTLLGLYRIAIGLETTPGDLLTDADGRFAEAAPWLAEAIRRGRVEP